METPSAPEPTTARSHTPKIEDEDDEYDYRKNRQPLTANAHPAQCIRERKLNPMMSTIMGKIGERGDQMCIAIITIWPTMNIAR